MALFLGTFRMARFLSNFCDQKEKCPKSLLDWSLTIEKCSVVFSNNKKLRSNFRSFRGGGGQRGPKFHKTFL